MKGTIILLIIGFTLATKLHESLANDPQFDVKVPNNVNENLPIFQKIETCAKTCKAGDLPCATNCLKKEVDVNDKVKLKNFLVEFAYVAQKVFCIVGCEATGLCTELEKTGMLSMSKTVFFMKISHIMFMFVLCLSFHGT